MALIQRLLLLLLLGSLAVLIAQNNAPPVALVVFGQKTQTLSLGAWMVIATGVGVGVAGIVVLLFWLSNILAPQVLAAVDSPPPVTPPPTPPPATPSPEPKTKLTNPVVDADYRVIDSTREEWQDQEPEDWDF